MLDSPTDLANVTMLEIPDRKKVDWALCMVTKVKTSHMEQ